MDRRPTRLRRARSGAGRVFPAVLALVAVLGAVGACGPSSGGPADDAPSGGSSGPSSSAPGEPSPTPTPAPTPTVDPHPPLAELVVSTSGLGPLTIGLPPESNPGAAMIAFDPDACADAELGETTGDPGRWLAAGYAPDAVAHGGQGTAFYVAVDPVRGVSWIDVLGASPRTVDGLGVGSLLEEVQAAYPTLQGPFEGPLTRVWWVPDATGTLVFETELDGALEGAPTGPERVELIRILLPDADPAFATAHSGWVASTC